MSYKIFEGDCLNVMPNIAPRSVDLVLADMPYQKTRCRWDCLIDIDAMWNEVKRIIKPNGVVLLHADPPFTYTVGNSNLPWFKYEITWEKTAATGFFNAKKQVLRAHEHVLVFCSGQGTYNPQITKGHARKSSVKRKSSNGDCYGANTKELVYDSTDRYPRSVQRFASDKQRRKLHPTQKPIALAEWLIKTFSNEGDTVLDFCFGSGTTGVAAINSGRKFIGIEKDSHFYQVGANELKTAMEVQL